MKRWSWLVVLPVLIGFIALPARGEDRLKLTGYVDNHIRAAKNFGSGDDDLTNNDDNPFEGRIRGRMFFHIQATENTKAVFAFEFDQKYGKARGDKSERSRNGGDFGMDNGNFELKWLYVDGVIPGTPVRFKLGAQPFKNTPMKNCLILCLDAMGVSTDIPIGDAGKLNAWLAWGQEDFAQDIGNPATLQGEDYALGVTLMLSPFKGLDIHPLFAFQHLSGPSFGGSVLRVSTGQDRENRFFLGFDARYKMGAITIHPTFIYEGGKREFDAAGASDSDLQSFLLDLLASVSMGPLKLSGRFVYTPGNEADDAISGGGDDINFFQSIFVDTVHRSVYWFEINGWNIDTTSTRAIYSFNDSRSLSGNLGFDQYGLIHGAFRADYKATKKLTLTGTLGFFSAAEDVGRPARKGPAAADTYNFTGEDKYLATEIDVWMSYQIYPKTTVQVWFAHSFNGDARNLLDPGPDGVNGTADDTLKETEDSTGVGARMIYRF
jgi:hypothetical protein